MANRLHHIVCIFWHHKGPTLVSRDNISPEPTNNEPFPPCSLGSSLRIWNALRSHTMFTSLLEETQPLCARAFLPLVGDFDGGAVFPPFRREKGIAWWRNGRWKKRPEFASILAKPASKSRVAFNKQHYIADPQLPDSWKGANDNKWHMAPGCDLWALMIFKYPGSRFEISLPLVEWNALTPPRSW